MVGQPKRVVFYVSGQNVDFDRSSIELEPVAQALARASAEALGQHRGLQGSAAAQGWAIRRQPSPLKPALAIFKLSSAVRLFIIRARVGLHSPAGDYACMERCSMATA
ncbi:uncharacterized protein VTP21DRAFT_9785 [Calcarisporiella thermophila]|uniref:uncharacterized protein n=1 Tax=Calcarisporiella thermophila TaxID=911321 RepID=UPI003742EE44